MKTYYRGPYSLSTPRGVLTKIVQDNEKRFNFRYEELLLEWGITSVATVEFKWMNDGTLSEEFIKVKLRLWIIISFSAFSGFLCPLYAPQSYFWEGNLDFHSWDIGGWTLDIDKWSCSGREWSRCPAASFPMPRTQISRPIAAGRLAAQQATPKVNKHTETLLWLNIKQQSLFSYLKLIIMHIILGWVIYFLTPFSVTWFCFLW